MNWTSPLRNGIFISQQKYVLDILKETRMLECKPANIPIEQNYKLEETLEDTVVDNRSYLKLVARLLYLSHMKPNIVVQWV